MKALWAFEPFHQDKERVKGMHNTLCLLTGSPSKIEVGFIATRTESSLNLAFDVPEKDRFTRYPLDLIKKELNSAGINSAGKKVHVLDYPTFSNTKAADRLLKLAADRGAGLVGLFTQSKSGYSRLVMGSFAETIIHRSRLSLLIVNPKTELAPKIKNILFASDFTAASKKHLKTVIAHCKKLNSALNVFHHADAIYKWSFDESNPKIRAYRKKVNQMKNWIESECRKAGVSAEVTIASEFKPTADLVFSNVKSKKIDLVVVSAKVGPLLALMGGSITRQIVRGSTIPVLVLK